MFCSYSSSESPLAFFSILAFTARHHLVQEVQEAQVIQAGQADQEDWVGQEDQEGQED